MFLSGFYKRCCMYVLVTAAVIFLIYAFSSNSPKHAYEKTTARSTCGLKSGLNMQAFAERIRLIGLAEPAKVARTGNWIFQVASAYGLARQSHRKVLLPPSGLAEQALRTLFDLPEAGHIVLQSSLYDRTSWTQIKERWICAYDANLLQDLNGRLADKDVQVNGFLQSYKYFQAYADDVRKLFTFKPAVRAAVDEYLHHVRDSILASRLDPLGLLGDPLFVGVHVRRGDLEDNGLIQLGYRTAGASYLYNAMHYFAARLSNGGSRFVHVAFIVCSDSPSWFERNFSLAQLRSKIRLSNKNATVSLHYPRERTASVKVKVNATEFEFGVLAHCNHSVMTVGTFGFSAAFLAGGVTTYYSTPFTNGSHLASWWNNRIDDYYPPDWIPLGD